MNILRVETTQNVFLEYNLAGLGERILAFLIDLFVMFLYVWLCLELIESFVRSWFRGENTISWTTFYILYFFVFILPLSTYSLVQEVFFNGQTIGKKILNIKVVTRSGKQPSLTQYVVRWLFRIIDIWATLGIVGLVVAATNRYYQRLGDLAADTCLIKLKSAAKLSQQVIIPEFDKLYEPKYSQVLLLSDTDINYVKEAVLTYEKFGNEEVLVPFAKKLKEILNLSDVRSGNYEFLKQIIKDYTYLTSKDEE
ncbi:MAG: RDD family protein [Raineya sp.]|nr:RDD family protein [Raineya sp.]